MRKIIFQILTLLLLVFGSFLIQKSISKFNENEVLRREENLNIAHKEALLSIRANLKVYSTLVSALKAFVNNSNEFPTEEEFSKFTIDLVKNSDFKNHVIVSYIDTNQIFRYSTTAKIGGISGLIGVNVNEFRSKKEIMILNSFMKEDKISLFPPINLVEGWAALPFNFSARNAEGKIFGYIAPLLDIKYLLHNLYNNNLKNEFKYRFAINDSIDFNREEIFDGSKKYNENKDPEYYKNFPEHNDFKYSTLKIYGQSIKIGTSYKEEVKHNEIINQLKTIWYVLLAFSIMVIIFQFYRYYKIEKELRKLQSFYDNQK